MTLGEKIWKYRLLRNMTQEELGIKIGFPKVNAGSRLRKYEGNEMAPKADIRNKLAAALEVDLSAISDINIRTYGDVLQILFLLEDSMGMEIERKDGKIYLSFEESNKEIQTLIACLNKWLIKKREILGYRSFKTEEQIMKYEVWKSRFGTINGENINLNVTIPNVDMTYLKKRVRRKRRKNL